MKKETIQIVEESHLNVKNVGKDFRFVIMYKPNKDSLEVKLYEKKYSITDVEELHFANKSVTDKIRLNTAVQVFEQFYKLNFIEE